MEIIKYYNGLEFWIEPENLPGKVKKYTARVSKVGSNPLMQVVIAVQDKDYPEVDPDNVDDFTLEMIYQTFIGSVMDGIQKSKDLGLFDKIF